MEVAWRDLQLDQITQSASTGRLCHPIYIDEGYHELAILAMSRMSRSDEVAMADMSGKATSTTLGAANESRQSSMIRRSFSLLSPPATPDSTTVPERQSTMPLLVRRS